VGGLKASEFARAMPACRESGEAPARCVLAAVRAWVHLPEADAGGVAGDTVEARCGLIGLRLW